MHLVLALLFATAADKLLVNPRIDMDAYLLAAKAAAADRVKHRVTEDEFLKMAAEPGTIVLDARSRALFDRLHIKGAVDLSFPDIGYASLAETIPDKNTRILIYCNNNFLNDVKAFPLKSANASLNLSTYIALYSYGYRNVYELGPLLDVNNSKLSFEGSERPHEGAQ